MVQELRAELGGNMRYRISIPLLYFANKFFTLVLLSLNSNPCSSILALLHGLHIHFVMASASLSSHQLAKSFWTSFFSPSRSPRCIHSFIPLTSLLPGKFLLIISAISLLFLSSRGSIACLVVTFHYYLMYIISGGMVSSS